MLSALGVALLGLSEGAVLAIPGSDGTTYLKLESVRFQPEAAGDAPLTPAAGGRRGVRVTVEA